METKIVILNYKSGTHAKATLSCTVEELIQKIKDKQIDVNPKTFSVINWGEVESISEVNENGC